MKKYIAEALGTFALSLTVALSLVGHFPIPTPVLAALVLGLFVYSVGHLSGTHINPAVTIGAWSIQKISRNDAIMYIIAQFVGAGATLGTLAFLGINSTGLAVFNNLTVGGAEALGTFFFTFGIASVIYGKAPHGFSGLVVGGSLLFGIAIAVMLGSNGVLNPAVALGIQTFSLAYVLGPIIGSVLGMQVYKALQT